LVFVTEYRQRVFSARHFGRMEEIVRAVCADFECELVGINGAVSCFAGSVGGAPLSNLRQYIEQQRPFRGMLGPWRPSLVDFHHCSERRCTSPHLGSHRPLGAAHQATLIGPGVQVPE
jgi:hypothetical protein